MPALQIANEKLRAKKEYWISARKCLSTATIKAWRYHEGFAVPLNLYHDIYTSGKVPIDWIPNKGGTLKYPVRNQAVYSELRRLLPGRWQKVIKQGNLGEVHYFEHESGRVAGIKYFSRV